MAIRGYARLSQSSRRPVVVEQKMRKYLVEGFVGDRIVERYVTAVSSQRAGQIGVLHHRMCVIKGVTVRPIGPA